LGKPFKAAYERLKSNGRPTLADLTEVTFEDYTLNYTPPAPYQRKVLIRDPLCPHYESLRYPSLLKVDAISRIADISEQLAGKLREALQHPHTNSITSWSTPNTTMTVDFSVGNLSGRHGPG
jgi:hypothetical protein